MRYGLDDEGEEVFDLSYIFGDREYQKMSIRMKAPEPLVVNSDIDMAQEWTEWLEMYEDYFTANKITEEDETIQVANFRSCVGREAVKVLSNLNLTDAEKKVLKTLKEKLTNHFASSKNKTYERCQFHRIKQQANENFEDFLQKLQTQVKKCSYGNNADEFIMDQIVVGIHSDTTRQKLWTEDDLKLDKRRKFAEPPNVHRKK